MHNISIYMVTDQVLASQVHHSSPARGTGFIAGSMCPVWPHLGAATGNICCF